MQLSSTYHPRFGTPGLPVMVLLLPRYKETAETRAAAQRPTPGAMQEGGSQVGAALHPSDGEAILHPLDMIEEAQSARPVRASRAGTRAACGPITGAWETHRNTNTLGSGVSIPMANSDLGSDRVATPCAGHAAGVDGKRYAHVMPLLLSALGRLRWGSVIA